MREKDFAIYNGRVPGMIRQVGRHYEFVPLQYFAAPSALRYCIGIDEDNLADFEIVGADSEEVTALLVKMMEEMVPERAEIPF